ncbi:MULTISPECIES: PilN domain-containing protein [Corallincola]|uniref:MSHA biogenesis protein MshI n=3 Tax=Corallincola TaxID=1775176 RepID=A0A368NKG1_9GAMM|nr:MULTISPECIES: PilN domain-containing protein [Corallincola]RCU49821.1 hypothetical protein DU002_09290 [Corallincola holothuriorum]TAA45203.1 hypothetical protein EXY25_13450 [Corallincola spongiicola]TCI03520.1 hypothetical protein EZV61_08195 [Corallincola luteus]
MKQHINLYVDALRPQRESLSLPVVLVFWCLSILFIAGSAIWLNSRLADAQYQLSMTQMTNKQLNQQLAALTQQLQQRQPSSNLVRKKELVTAEHKVKTHLLRELSNREPLKNQGFSQLMLELAKHHDDDVWLSGIKASETNLALTGFTRTSKAVPRWVQGFHQGPRLQKAGFASLSMSRDENQRLLFTLSSLPGESE